MVVVIRCDRCGMELVIKADSIREFSVCQLADRIEYTIRIEMEEGETFERIEMLSGKFILCKKCMEDFRRETAEFEKKFMNGVKIAQFTKG